jgi:hypothetical protein
MCCLNLWSLLAVLGMMLDGWEWYDGLRIDAVLLLCWFRVICCLDIVELLFAICCYRCGSNWSVVGTD